MISAHRRWLGGFAAAMVLFPTSVAAQTVAQSFADLQQILQRDETIVVTDEDGRKTKGKVADTSADSLVILTPERRTFSESDVRELTRADPLGNGTLIGLLAGAGVAGIAIATCDRDEDAEACANAVRGQVLLAPIGAGIGLLIDALRRTTVYAAPAAAVGVSSLPTRSSGAPGVGVASSFSELRLLVKPGQVVSLTDTSRRQIRGRIVELSAASVALMVEGARLAFAESEVEQIRQRGDPLWNGALIGLGVGVGTSFLSLAGCDGGLLCAAAAGPTLLLGAGIGTATGVLVDALHAQHKLVYLTPNPSETRARHWLRRGSDVAVSPLLGKGRQGVLVSVGF